MTDCDKLTREEARALIAEHKIVALEHGHDLGFVKYEERYESDHNQFFRLGNGRLLWRQDSDECCGEEWYLMHNVIDAEAVDAQRALTG